MPDNTLPALLEQARPEIEARIRDWMTPARFMAMAQSIIKNPELAKCSPASVINCILQAAEAGIEIGGIDQHSVIVPYSGEAQLQIMWRGIIYRLVEAGVVAHLYADLVYSNDQFEVISGSVRKLIHHPMVFGDRGNLLGAYAVATLPNGMTDFEIFELKDIKAVKDAALRMAERKKPGSGLSPAWRFFEGEMIRKSVIRRLAKRLQGNRAKNEDVADRLTTAMQLAETSFDAETIATELTEEERPKAAPKPAGKVAMRPEPEPHAQPAQDGPVGEADGEMLAEMAQKKGLGFRQQQALLKKWGIGSYEELPAASIRQFVADIEGMANA